jgi:hypothetical protein
LMERKDSFCSASSEEEASDDPGLNQEYEEGPKRSKTQVFKIDVTQQGAGQFTLS